MCLSDRGCTKQQNINNFALGKLSFNAKNSKKESFSHSSGIYLYMYKLANLKKIYTSLPTSFLCRALQCSSWSSVIFIFESQGIKDTVSRNSKISFIWVNARFSWVPISLLLSPSLAFC